MGARRHGGCRYNEFGDRKIHAESYRGKDCCQDHFRGGFLDEIRFREFSGRVGFSHGDVNGLDVEIRRSEPVVAPPRSKKRKLSLITCDGGESKCSGIVDSNIKNVVVVQDDVSIDVAERPAENEVVLPKNLVEETEDFFPVWNISSSRWADANDALADDEAGKATNPELGEIVSSDSLEREVSKALGSEGGHGSSGSNDLMDIDKEEADDEGNGCLSETDVEPEDGEFGNRESPIYSSSRSINMLQSCRGVDEYEKLNKINEGTYGVVYRARDKKTGEIVALKKVKMEREREGFPLTSLREINILLSLHHPSVIDVKEVVTDSSLNNIFMVMEYMDCDLKGLMERMKQPFSQSEVKCLMLQLLEGVKYLHDNWVLHRDLKTSNVLFNNRGELKVCDFGLSRQYGSPLKPYTPLVVTLWYRAPELLLGAKGYSEAIDMWSLGCIMAELLTKEPLFNGKNEIEQLGKIFEMLGTPTEETWPGFTKFPSAKVKFAKQTNKLWQKFRPTSFSGCPILSLSGLDLLLRLLTCDPEKRITAEEALQHDWFCEIPLPKSKEFMPTFPVLNIRAR